MDEERITQKYKEVMLCDGKVWKIYPLTLKQAKESAPIISKIQGLDENTNLLEPEVFDNVVKICTIILKRTKADIKESEVETLIDIGNVKEVIGAGFGA